MGSVSHDDVEPVTERRHDNSWSANLEKSVHAEERDIVVTQAKDAVEHTLPGNHVNLVTHGNHGHPETYLYDELRAAFDGVDLEYVEQCGCGGHVTRVHVSSDASTNAAERDEEETMED
ncbi:CGCGG family rSAM-modified RiPP protein [Halostella sp. PRR32]|uniref:CGCGG family putative rSAM-modified RiPP protein n=1 Tax=Halostella sp. PRR32 TaxID=3098147 RepID=UPI002B1D2ACE|nr:CGCGG family rSAM-modified RiPP protein [Halostella sp. PRR32]